MRLIISVLNLSGLIWRGMIDLLAGCTPTTSRRSHPTVEALEVRLAPAAFTWIGHGSSPSWFDPANWTSTGAPTTIYPTANDDVIIGTTGPTTIGVPADASSFPSANSLTTSGDVTLAVPLDLDASLNVSGFFRPQRLVSFSSLTATITGGGSVIGGGFSGGGTLTILDSVTISGSFSFFGFGQLINHGTIQAASGGTIFIDPLNFVNQGTLNAQSGGTLDIADNTWSTSTPITCTDTGTVLLDSGTLNNGATPVVFSGNGTWLFSGVTVKNTTVDLTSGAKGTVLHATLDGATFNGDTQVSSVSGSGGSLVIRNSDTINGTLTLGDNTATQNGEILFDGVGTIDGDLTIISDDASKHSGNPNNIIQVGFGSPTVTTLAPAVTIRGSSLELTGASTNTLINQGVISADVAGSTFTMLLLTWQNNGTVQAKNGGHIDADNTTFFGTPIPPSTLTNFGGGTLTAGTWQVYDGSTIHLPITDITTNAANILLDGPGAKLLRDNDTSALTNLGTNDTAGSLTVQDGQVLAVGPLTNAGTLTLGPAGTLAVGGSFTQTASGVLGEQINGPSASGQFGKLQASGNTTLDGALSVSEPGGYVPSVGDGYRVLTFASRTGDFASKNGLVLSDALSLLPTYDAVSLSLVAEAPPAVQAVVVNDGSAQRSMVNSLTVTFSGVVTLGAGAIEVDKVGGGAKGVVISTSVVGGQTVAVIAFTGSDIIAGSLGDGRYNLVIHGDLIQDASGQTVDGDGDGLAGGDKTVSFFRLFGDATGDGVVDARDYAIFRSAYGSRVGQAAYLWYLDYNADGVIDRTDYDAFRLNYGRHI